MALHSLAFWPMVCQCGGTLGSALRKTPRRPLWALGWGPILPAARREGGPLVGDVVLTC